MSLSLESLPEIVARHVNNVEAIDVHTHLLPPTHAALLLYGVDELLTYHYLVAELFMVLPAVDSEEDSTSLPGKRDPPTPSPNEFFSWTKAQQADLVFDELFVKRTPLSEACRGVITALSALGLGPLLREARDAPAQGSAAPTTDATSSRLAPLRAWFESQPTDAHVERVFVNAKLKYAVMTNIPFAPEEAMHWFPSGNAAESGVSSPSLPFVTPRLRPALRVDPLLSADWPTLNATLRRATPPYPPTVRDCVDFSRPGCSACSRSTSWPPRQPASPTHRRLPPPKRKRDDVVDSLSNRPRRRPPQSFPARRRCWRTCLSPPPSSARSQLPSKSVRSVRQSRAAHGRRRRGGRRPQLRLAALRALPHVSFC